jgi:hypothetical protein
MMQDHKRPGRRLPPSIDRLLWVAIVLIILGSAIALHYLSPG